ncbi:MAG TPA: mechanosensitive ion channel family protein [Candidatus Saccharimonadales bacterium]
MNDVFLALVAPKNLLFVAIVIAISLTLQYFCKKIVQGIVRHSVRAAKFETKREEIQREDTLISIVYTTSRVLIWIIALLLILQIYKINIAPIIAGAGVVGIALGFGAQTIIKDFLAGMFILAENQYRVGDVLMVNQDVSGTVESISLRMTVLRGLDGRVHYVPNGTIQIATNLTMEFASVELDMNVGYDSNLDKVERTVNKVGQKIYDDPEWKGIALEPPHMLRVDRFTDTAIVIKIVCKTAPIRQWEVRSEILRHVKKAFEKEGIDMPHRQPVAPSQADKDAEEK